MVIKTKMYSSNRPLNHLQILIFIIISINVRSCIANCNIPDVLQGTWFSQENDQNIETNLNTTFMSGRGHCMHIKEHNSSYSILFKNEEESCYKCIKFFVRTINVLETIETPCASKSSFEELCGKLTPDQPIVTYFAIDYVPVNCNSSLLKGVWHFTYQNPLKFPGECNHPDALIQSVQQPGSEVPSTNHKFNITYKKCPGIAGTFNGVVEYNCLGDWFVGENHYFAVANTRESRNNEKYRCFLKNKYHDLHIGVSTTAECKLDTVDASPEILHLTPVRSSHESCTIPTVLQGSWFSLENGNNTMTNLDATTMTGRGNCVWIKKEHHDNYTVVFKANKCYTCVQFLIRTVNVLEKIETPCVNVSNNTASLEYICRGLNPDQQLITLFSENYVPVSCRSSLEGAWNFAYQNRFRFTGECNHPDALIQSCQQAGSQFLITNQKFNISYKKCPGMMGTFDGVVEYSCLGDWFVDKNHYFAVANTKESRRNEKYRCFLKNRNDDSYIGVSVTAECNTLKTIEKSPERLHVTPVEPEYVEPGCQLPQKFSGDWINTANIDADIFINETHIIETWNSDEGKNRKTIYVCKEQRGTRVMMARLTVNGCQKDYVCFDFVPQHHNVIRYRKGMAVIANGYNTVCSSAQFQNQVKLKYALYLRKNPVAIKCPVAGEFNFTQKGDILFETRIIQGITLSPRPDIQCKQNVSIFSVCDTDQKEIAIDETYCEAVDYRGRPVEIYRDTDYEMKCIAYWRENMKSYLITYDRHDPISKYKCWVYQRTDLNRIFMSQAIGSFCDLKQDAYSSNYTEGAAVRIELQEYEREHDQCPMHYDDGEKL